MGKFLIGAATAALWFVLSHAANAEGVSGPGVDAHAPGVSIEIGR
jgi:hypothetical protein